MAVGILGVVITIAAWLWPVGPASPPIVRSIFILARDLDQHPLAGFQFAYRGVSSAITGKDGGAKLELPRGLRMGQPIEIQLLSDAGRNGEWVLVSREITIPGEPYQAEVVLVERAMIRAIAAAAHPGEVTSEERQRVLVAEAARHGLSREQFEAAVRSFAETKDETDRGIAAYLQNRLPKAEALLREVVERRKDDLSSLAEALRYLGAVQYDEGNYGAAASSYRSALVLHDNDTDLLRSLGASLTKMGEWRESEEVLRRALALDQQLGLDRPEVAADLNNLAELYRQTSRLTEAEPLMRRALAIDERRFGPLHTVVARDLNDLAALLLAANRLAEAEPLMRRAVAILVAFKRDTGHEHPNWTAAVRNYRSLLEKMGRSESEIDAAVKQLRPAS